MITLIPNKINVSHNVDVLKSIGNFRVGDSLNIRILAMSGRRYEPGKDSKGKFLDAEGRPEDRYMAFTGEFYAVGTKSELDAAFNEH